MYYFKL